MCTLHEGSYENDPNIPTFKIVHIDEPSRLALALRLISKLLKKIQPEVTDGTYAVLMWRDGDYV